MNQQWNIGGSVNPNGLMKTRDSSSCVDAKEANTDGAKPLTSTCKLSSVNQNWIFDNQTAQLRLRDGNCLDAPQRQTAGAEVRMLACAPGSQNQHWAYDSNTAQLKITDGLCLAVKEGSSQNSGLDLELEMATCDTSAENQQWIFPESGALGRSVPVWILALAGAVAMMAAW